jgi:hypothetical protein
MRVAFACVTLLVATIGSIAPASAQSVDELVQKYYAARGGYDKIKAIQTLKVKRLVATPFAKVNVVIYKKRPQLYRNEQAPTGQPMVARGINPEAAWDTGAGGKITLRSEPLATESRELDADFDGLLVDWKEKGHTVALEGTEKLTAGEAYKLKVTTKGGAVRYIYLDAKTFLDRRHVGKMNLPSPPGAPPRSLDVVWDFSDWRDVNGVKFPFAIDEERSGPRDPTQSFAAYTEKIEANLPMEDSLFAIPAK